MTIILFQEHLLVLYTGIIYPKVEVNVLNVCHFYCMPMPFPIADGPAPRPQTSPGAREVVF